MLENYQSAAEIIVLIVYAVVAISILVAAVAGLRYLLDKRVGRIDNTGSDQSDSD